VIGFFPYEKPKYAFVVLMEAGPSQGTTGAAFISRELFDWMNENTPEYFSTE
jgi:penicillin-binding protein 2